MNETSALFTQAATPSGDASTKEQEVNEVINETLAVAAPFIPGGPVAVKVAALTGLAPAAVHLGFVFAHLFSHPKIKALAASSSIGALSQPDLAAATAAAAEKNRQDAALIADAEKQKQKDVAVKAIQDQMTELQSKLAALQSN